MPLRAQAADPVRNEYRVTMFPAHPLSESVSAFGYLGYVSNPEVNTRTYYVGFPGISWRAAPWVDLWAGLIGVYNAVDGSSDTYELRPFFGPKFVLPNRPVSVYTWPRFEYRSITTKDTDVTSSYWRLRWRFGTEFALSERKYEKGSWYALGDVEPYYRFDKGFVDQLRWRVGLGYVPSQRVRLELQYYMQFGRADGEPLQHNANIFRLNIKVATKRGLLGRLFDFDE